MMSLAVQESKLLTLSVFSKGTSLLTNFKLGCLVVGYIHVLAVPDIVTASLISPMEPIVHIGP